MTDTEHTTYVSNEEEEDHKLTVTGVRRGFEKKEHEVKSMLTGLPGSSRVKGIKIRNCMCKHTNT